MVPAACWKLAELPSLPVQADEKARQLRGLVKFPFLSPRKVEQRARANAKHKDKI